MKINIKKQLYLLLFLIPVFAGCNKEPDYYTLNAPNDQMKVTASSDSITLERAYQDKEAVNFTWNEAANRGSDTQMTYYFRLYNADAKDQVSELVKIDAGTRSISWTNRQINDLLASWGFNPGDKVNLVGEVIANVVASKTYMKPETSKVQIKVAGYDPQDIMYIWTLAGGSNRVITMETASDDSIYHWSGTLSPCEYWFSTDKNNGNPAYVKGGTDNTLTYSKTNAGNHFTVTEAGLYDITVNLNKMTVSIAETPVYHAFYMVSSTNGSETVSPMDNLDDGSDYFHWSGTLTAGTQIRFASDMNNTWPAYVPDANDNSKLVIAQSGATMLNITKTANYEITVNLADKKLVCLDVYKLPYGGMWATGDAVPAGWDNGRNNCPFVQNDLKNHPEIWTLKTNFNGGNTQFKIITVPGQWWYEIVSVSPTNVNPCNVWLDAGVRGVNNLSGDNKFIPGVTGVWTVKVDLHSMKVTMVQ